MSTHISQKMKLHVSSHSEIDFVDIVLSPDTKLFLDPCLIEFGKSPISKQAQHTISSYFDCFYNLYRKGTASSYKLNLFEHAHEINATKLGYGSGHNGKAKTPSGMLHTFMPIDLFFKQGINLQTASDLPIFINDFAEDCLSDMLTNILFKDLSCFTIQQCQKYNIKTYPIPDEFYYWDVNKNSWMIYEGNCLLIDGKVILLVPKFFVRQRYYFNTSQYFSRVILSKIQNDETWVDSKGKKQSPSKDDLRKRYKGDAKILECSVKFTCKEPSFLSTYHRMLPSLYFGQSMTDDELDEILYKAS